MTQTITPAQAREFEISLRTEQVHQVARTVRRLSPAMRLALTGKFTGLALTSRVHVTRAGTACALIDRDLIRPRGADDHDQESGGYQLTSDGLIAHSIIRFGIDQVLSVIPRLVDAELAQAAAEQEPAEPVGAPPMTAPTSTRDYQVAVRDLIRDRPELHNQGAYFAVPNGRAPAEVAAWLSSGHDLEEWQCGTTGCVAGWAILIGGWRPVALYSERHGFLSVHGEADPFTMCEVVRPDGTGGTARGGVMDVAAHLLGLTEEQAEHLFAGDNSRAYVLDYLDRLIDGRPLPDRPGWATAPDADPVKVAAYWNHYEESDPWA